MGRFGSFSTFGEGERRYFDVKTTSLDMHIRPLTIGSVFAVKKPGQMDGVSTLSPVPQHEGLAAFKVLLPFGGCAPPAQRVEQFNGIRSRFAVQPRLTK